MSVVVQELYSGLSAALSTERTSLPNPIRVLGAKPKAEAFVRTCRRLPPEQQSTHGLKISLSNFPERLDHAAKASHPGLMDLLGKQPGAARAVVEQDQAPSRNRTQQVSCHDSSRVDLGVAEAMVGLPLEDFVLFPLTVKEASSSKEKEPRLIQEGRDFSSRPSCLERADLLQNLEEDLAKVQVTPETLSDPMPETQGMTADGTAARLFSQTGEGRSRVSTGLPLTERRPCSDANTAMTKVTISGKNASLEPLSHAENPSAKDPRQGKEECQSLTACAPFSAAGLALSCLQSGGDAFLGQDEGMSPVINACPSLAQQEKMDDSDATPKISFDACLVNTSFETSDCLFKGDLEFGEILWEEPAGVQAVCQVGQECEEVEFLDWASEPKKGESLSQTWSNAEPPSARENGEAMASWGDHTYSCLSRRGVGVQKVADLQRNNTDKMQEGSHPKNPAALQVANCVRLESGTPLHHVARLPKDECPVSPGSEGIREKEWHPCPWPCDGGLKGRGTPWVEASDRSRASTESQPTSHDRLEPDGGFGGVTLLQTKPCDNQRSGLQSGFGATRFHAESSSEVCLTAGKEYSEPALFCEELSFAQPRDMDLGGPEFTDSLLREDSSGARATLAAQNPSCLLHNKDELTSISWDGGDCATTNDQREHSVDVKWGDAEDTLADVGRAWNKAHHSSDLCLAAETGGTISGDASRDVLEVGTLSNCEESEGLGVSHTCAPEKNAFFPSVCGARDPEACPACEESLDHLNGVGKALSAVCSLRLSEPCIEAETQRTDGEESFADSEGLPDRNRSGFTPLAKPQQEARAEGLSVLESVGVERVEAVQTEEGNWGSELGGKHTWEQDLDETVFPELAKIVTDQSKEGDQIHPTFSSVNHLCHLKSSFPEQAEPLDRSLFEEDFCSADPDQAGKAICQMQTHLRGPQDNPLDRLALFNQRNKVPEAEACERSPFPLELSEKQNVDPVLQTVTHSAVESPEHAHSRPRASACLQKTQDVTLPISVLLLEKGAQETSQQNRASSSDKMPPELTERRLKEDPKEVESFKPFPGCLESLPGPLKGNSLLKDRPCQGEAEEISSASKAAIGTPSDAVGENQFLKCDREPASSPGQTHFQPGLPTFIPVDDQKSREEVWAESFRSKEVSGLAGVNLGIQPHQSPGSWLAQEDEPLASLSSKAPLPPKVEEGPPGTLLVKSDAFPVVFPLEAEMETRPPPHVCFPGGTSKLDFLPEAQDLAGATEDIKRHEEKLSRPVPLFPRRNPPETLSRSLTFAFQDRTLLEASTLCLRTGRRRWQAVESGLGLTGGHKERLESRLGSYVTDAPVRTFGLEGCPKPTAELLEVEQMVAPVGAWRDGLSPRNRAEMVKMRSTGVLERRILAAPRNLAGSSSLGRILKLKELGRQAACSKSLAGDRENGALGSTCREPERPERSVDLLELRHTEAKTLDRGFRTAVQPPASKGNPLPLSPMVSKPAGFSSRESRSTFGASGRMKSTLLFGRQAGKAPGKAQLLPSPTFLKNPSEMLPRHGAEPLDPVCALRVKRTMIWNHTPKPSVSQSWRLDPFRPSRHTKETPKLFRELSTLADKLLAPPRNPHKLQPRLRSSALLPVPEKYGHQRRPMLPEMFSCVNIEFNSPWLHGGSCWFQMFSSQPVARGSVESTQMCFFGMDSKAPWVFGAPVFPVSFHVQVEPSSSGNFLGRESLLNVSKRLVVGEAPARQASGWTFSILLSRSHLDVAPCQKDAHFPPAPAKAWVPDAMAQNNAHGLQTILALLSPGFCRLWRKRWHRTHRALGLQTLTLLQLTRGLKGLKKASLPVSADLASSMPYALGKSLSLWSQQGLSTMATSASAPLPLLSAGSRCKWHPAPATSANLSLRNNSRAMWPPGHDQVIEASLAVKEEAWWKLPFPRLVPRSCRVTELAQPRLGLSTPEFQIHRLDELETSAPVLLPKSGKATLEKRPQKVSQIRIRKTIPKPDPNLTPMGLPRPKRLKKTEFSLEEIYTNKNYKSPPATRCLETIFEEPKEKNGSLVAVSHQKRKRVLEFQDFTIPRKRKARSRVKVAGSFTRAQKAALEGRELDVLLIQRLTDLETFFAEQEKGAAS